MKGKRNCPVCGKEIVGRADKIYCCPDCRVYANNERKRAARRGGSQGTVAEIEEELAIMYNGGGRRYVKIISMVTRFCKILYKFGR